MVIRRMPRSALCLKVAALPLTKSLHVSFIVSRRVRGATASSQDDEHEADLFSTTEFQPPVSDQSNRSERRLELIRTISRASSLPNAEKKRTVSITRIGTLRKVVQLCDTAEELNDLRGALRGWRVMGIKVTGKTAEEIIGRCCNLGRPELAVELIEDRLQYGLPPLTTSSLVHIHRSLLSSESQTTPLPRLPTTQVISPSLALARLVLLQQRSANPSESEPLLSKIQAPGRSENTAKAKAQRKSWLDLLETAGGSWAEAGRKVMESEAMREVQQQRGEGTSA